MNKKYVAIGLVAVLLASAGGAAYYKKTHEASINVLATTDIHGATSRAMIKAKIVNWYLNLDIL